MKNYNISIKIDDGAFEYEKKISHFDKQKAIAEAIEYLENE